MPLLAPAILLLSVAHAQTLDPTLFYMPLSVGSEWHFTIEAANHGPGGAVRTAITYSGSVDWKIHGVSKAGGPPESKAPSAGFATARLGRIYTLEEQFHGLRRIVTTSLIDGIVRNDSMVVNSSNTYSFQVVNGLVHQTPRDSAYDAPTIYLRPFPHLSSPGQSTLNQDSQWVDASMDDHYTVTQNFQAGVGPTYAYERRWRRPGSMWGEMWFTIVRLSYATIVPPEIDTTKADTAKTDTSTTIPDRIAIFQNYPNPFNSSTVIGYQLSVAGDVSLVLHDFLGRDVAVLVNERKAEGVHYVTFSGSGLSSGVYFYRLKVGNVTQTRKAVFLK